ncbi:MAG: hypothetical protein KAS30_00100, partial [Candidatus Diapherotrites archaeon]|nr:hypothetical protein [Candidatus Diapherotrites archaeon]
SKSVDHELVKKLMFTEQDTSIQNFLGSNLYNNLLEEIDGASIAGNRLELIKKHLRPALFHLTYSSLAVHGKFRLTDKGILEQSDTNASQADDAGLRKLETKHNNKAQFYLKLAFEFICENSASFKDYSSSSEDGGVNPSKRPYFSGIQY